MEDVITQFKICGYKVGKRTFLTRGGRPVQTRLDLSANEMSRQFLNIKLGRDVSVSKESQNSSFKYTE